MVSPVLVENECSVEQDVLIAGPSRAKSPRVENISLENLKASLKKEITSEIKNLLAESQRELLKLLKAKVGGCVNKEEETSLESETRSFYTPTKSIMIKSTQNNDTNLCPNAGKLTKEVTAQYVGFAPSESCFDTHFIPIFSRMTPNFSGIILI